MFKSFIFFVGEKSPMGNGLEKKFYHSHSIESRVLVDLYRNRKICVFTIELFRVENYTIELEN